MRALALKVAGAFLLEHDVHADERGHFVRFWCTNELGRHGLHYSFVQSAFSWNALQGTVRGLHYQLPPKQEAKVVQVVRGAIYDVVVDLRADSPTYTAWDAVELRGESGRSVYIPEGCAHGFQTLENDTAVAYALTEFYNAEASVGIHWADPILEIAWPLDVTVISERDDALPTMTEVFPAQFQ